jgi:hypothetical protein
MSLANSSITRWPVCYQGSNFLYTQSNSCSNMGSDMRLSGGVPGGPAQEKCSSLLLNAGDKLVKADDFWTAVASPEHDPCGWPFMECVADCSLPSNPAAKSWTVAANGSVMDPALQLPVGCTDSGTDCSTQQVMKDPRVANQIAAM